MKTKLCDLTLLFCGLAQLCCGIVFHSCFEKCKYLGRGLSCRAYDEDSPKFLLVAPVCVFESKFGCFVVGEGRTLFLRRPAQRFFGCVGLRAPLADARVAVECLLPCLLGQGEPDACRSVDQGSFIRDGPARGERCRPCLGTAAGKCLAGGGCRIKRVPSGQNFVPHRLHTIACPRVRRVSERSCLHGIPLLRGGRWLLLL